MERIGENVEYEMENAPGGGKLLHLRINPFRTGEASKSGKSLVVASTRGNVIIPGTNGGALGLNFYRPA